MEYNYSLSMQDGQLMVTKRDYNSGEPLSWSPRDETYMSAGTSTIRFTVYNGEAAPYHGIIYIETSGSADFGRVYMASLEGTGLRLSQNTLGEGGIISPE